MIHYSPLLLQVVGIGELGDAHPVGAAIDCAIAARRLKPAPFLMARSALWVVRSASVAQVMGRSYDVGADAHQQTLKRWNGEYGTVVPSSVAR